MVRDRDGRPPRGPSPLAVHCFCLCSGGILLGDLLGASRSRERDLLSVLSIYTRCAYLLYIVAFFVFVLFCYNSMHVRWLCLVISTCTPSVWPHLLCGAVHEKMRGEQKWSLAFRLYIGSSPCAQLPGPVHTARLGQVCFCVFSLGFIFCIFVCIALICSCVPMLLLFPGQLRHLLTGFGTGVTDINEPLRAFATSTIAWVSS